MPAKPGYVFNAQSDATVKSEEIGLLGREEESGLRDIFAPLFSVMVLDGDGIS